MMKKAMVDAWEAGVFDKTGVPHLSIHDELCFSYHPDLHEYFVQAKQHLENAVKLAVPVVANAALGNTWGECKDVAW
jgi:DNA polymerase I-like protein with 3'-5' exonuclease and polymerase domains